jgi:hypothetical protein
MKFKEITGYIIAFTLTSSALLTWFGHDFYNVTGIKQPDFPMNILFWLIPISKILFSIGIGYIGLLLWQLKQKLNTLETNQNNFNDLNTKVNNLYVQNTYQQYLISLLNFVSFTRVEKISKSPFNPNFRKTDLGWEIYPKEVREYLEIEQLSMKEFLRDNYPKLTNEEIDVIVSNLKLNYK